MDANNPVQFNAGDALAQGLPAAGSAFLGGSAMGSPILGAVMGLGTLGLGLYQKYRASQMKVPNRPVAMTPLGIQENVFNARNVASGALGNATNTLAQQQLNQNTARGVMASREGARSGTDLLASVGGLTQNQNNAQNNLAQQNYQQRLGGFGMLAGANQANAGYDDRNFNYNQVQPYNQAYQNALNASAAGNANLNTTRQEGMGMLNQAAALAPYGYGNFAKMFGGQGANTQAPPTADMQGYNAFDPSTINQPPTFDAGVGVQGQGQRYGGIPMTGQQGATQPSYTTPGLYSQGSQEYPGRNFWNNYYQYQQQGLNQPPTFDEGY